jgi:hypothetical protein
MKRSHSWKINTSSVIQDISNILWHSKLHYRVHKSPSLAPILCHMNPGRNLSTHFVMIYFNIIFAPTTIISVGLIYSDFSTKTLYVLTLSITCATCHANLIPLNLIILIIFGEEYKPWSSSLFNIFQPPIISSSSRPIILFLLRTQKEIYIYCHVTEWL